MRSIIQHLRFPFSLLLMPVFWFSILFLDSYRSDVWHLILLFAILHVLVYPASNAYNSTQDNDEGSVGLIENPLPIPKYLFIATIVLDTLAIISSFLINNQVALLVIIYIVFSKLYSWRKVRLKRFPILGFLTVFICQGSLVFYTVQAVQRNIWEEGFISKSILYALVASLFIGSMYPLSQIYQHEQDKRDGVTTISALLGYRNTFLFSAFQFAVASALISYLFLSEGRIIYLIIYAVSQLPIIIYFLYWFRLVTKDKFNANFKRTMQMNIISSVCMNLCFIVLIWKRFFA